MFAPSMTLFHNPASPFVRKVLVLLHETGQQDRVVLETVLVTPVNPITALNEGNPLIPRDGSARWRRLTLASMADGIMDAAVLVRYETAMRPADKHWDSWLQEQRNKIRRALAELEQDAIAELASHFDIAAISVACALAYVDFRHPDLQWRSSNPKLAAWYAEVSQRPSMLATQPPT